MVYKPGSNRLFLNVGYVLGEAPIREHFSQFGKVLDVYLPRSKKTDATLGYGFATFESAEEVERALAAGSEHLIDGVSVKVNRAGPRPNYDDAGPVQGPHGTGPRLYIGGVPPSLEPEDIREHFSRWGQVHDIYFPPQRSGKRSLYCFVRFANYSEAKRAYTESQRRINGQDVDAINLAKDRLQPKEPQCPEIQPRAAPDTAPLGAAIPPIAANLTPGLVGNLGMPLAASHLGMLPMLGQGVGIKPKERLAMVNELQGVGPLPGAEMQAGLPWGMGAMGPGLFPGVLAGSEAAGIRMSGYGAPAGGFGGGAVARPWGPGPAPGGLLRGAIGRMDGVGGYGPQRRHSHGVRPMFNPY